MDLLVTTADKIPEIYRTPDLGKIKYTRNWNNKLDCRCYTTITLADPAVYWIGRKMRVYVHGKRKHEAEIVDVKCLRIEQINEWMARLDMGYNRAECIRIIKNLYGKKLVDWETQPLNLILFHQIEYNPTYKE